MKERATPGDVPHSFVGYLKYGDNVNGLLGSVRNLLKSALRFPVFLAETFKSEQLVKNYWLIIVLVSHYTFSLFVVACFDCTRRVNFKLE